MKKILFALALATLGATESIGKNKTQEINFAETFRDSTLRIDYIFSGNATTQRISLDKLNMSPRWYGKRKHLAQLPVEGNGQITVRKHGTSEVIYRNSFSTLFQEWQ